jgi:hypothetical protein
LKKTYPARHVAPFVGLLLLGLVLVTGCPVEDVPDKVLYTITVVQPPAGGTLTAQPGGGQSAGSAVRAAAGDTVTLTATPAEGYSFERFAGWQASVTGTVGTFTMPAHDVTVSAVFIFNGDPEEPGPDNPDPEDPEPEDPDPEDSEPEDPEPEDPDPEDPEPEEPEDPEPEDPPGGMFTGVRDGLGVYVYDRNPKGVEFFAQWVGLDVKYAEDFLGYDYWQSYTGDWWNDYNPQYWSAWKAANPEKRLILAVSPFPKNGLPGSWDGGKAATPEARVKYQEAANGDYNTYYRQLGVKLKELGLGDTIIRFGHEMSGNWYIYSIRADGDSEAIRQEKQINYGKAFNEFAKTLKGIEGTNFEFCWNPATDADPAYVSRCYPGDEHVDYIAFDQYDYWMNAYDRNDYHNSTDPVFRRTIQAQAWNQMMNRWSNPNWFAAFAKTHNKPLAVAEWGLWRDNRNSGYDNPYFIEKMYQWIIDNDVVWHTYFMFGDVSHSLYDTETYPLASQKFQELWNPRGSPQVSPAVPPSAVSGYTGAVKRGRDAAFGDNVALVSDPWAWSGGKLAGMWAHNDALTANTSITFENCPASSGFALVYQLWHSNLSNSEWDNNQRVSLYVNGNLIQSGINLQHGGRGWGDSYMIKDFGSVTIPAGASITFKADSYNWAWTRLNFDYIVFK